VSRDFADISSLFQAFCEAPRLAAAIVGTVGTVPPGVTAPELYICLGQGLVPSK